MKIHRLFAVLLILTVAVCALSAQEISEKQDIAVFSLSYADWSIPSGALGLVDQSIQNVFIDLGRFNIYGMTYRLQGNDIQTFIDQIKKYKEENIEIPEEVRTGEATFTEADFNKLVGSFIVVIPVMSYYDVQADGGEYDAEIQTSFTFVDVQAGTAMASFQIDTVGSGDSAKEAVKGAVDAIPMQLQFQIRSIPAFQLKTGIIDRDGRDFIIEFGTNMGVKVGDEYAIVENRVLSSGRQVSDETGLLIIKNVSSDVSSAQAIYSKGKPNIGDQLREIPRYGFDALVYGHYLPVEDNTGTDAEEKDRIVLGLRAVMTRGFFGIRPVAGVEVPLGDAFWFWFPVTSYVGVEANWMLGRLSLNPSAVVGVGALVPITADDLDDADIIGSFGGTAQVALNYLVSRDIKITAYGGYSMYIGLIDDWVLNNMIGGAVTNPTAYSGIFAGAGVTFKL
jgi:hypothetical protein